MIPKVAHCIFGLQPDFGGKPFSFVHWAAIKSFKKIHPDFQIFFWYHHLPQGYYFRDCAADITPSYIEPPQEIFGHELVHFAHKADILRLNLLIEHGGIYIDLDSLTVGSVEPFLADSFVMGEQFNFGQLRGLCNAIMLGEKNAQFALHWLESYRSFRSRGHDEYWDEHSVLKPLEIARDHPGLITIVSNKCFFSPDWTPRGVEAMFVESNRYPEAIIHHLWESCSWRLVSRFNENSVAKSNSTYARLVRTHLGEEIRSLSNLSAGETAERASLRRNARCPCGSGWRYKHCHGA